MLTAIRKMTAKLKSGSPAAEYLQQISQTATADRKTSLKAYRSLVLALSRDQAPEIPADQLPALLTHLGFDEGRLAEDVSRARDFAKHSETESSIFHLESAKAAAESELSDWTEETDRITQEREPKRAELAYRFREAEDDLRTAREQVRQAPIPETLPDEFISVLAKIERCLQQSSKPVGNAHFAARSAERELARLKETLKAAETPEQKKEAKEALSEREPELTHAIETSRSFEDRLKDLRATRERAMWELVCQETGLFIGEVPASEYFAGLDLSELASPRDSF